MASRSAPHRLWRQTIASGPFKPDWESLKGQYQAPDWFRDAKFGIWAHWSRAMRARSRRLVCPQHVYPGQQAISSIICRTYGHPADTGFMEINNRWKAENWHPDELMDLYVKAGASYFVSLANHHDNFDNYQFPLPRLEQHADRAQAGHRRRLGQGGAGARPEVRRLQPFGPCLALVPGRLWL